MEAGEAMERSGFASPIGPHPALRATFSGSEKETPRRFGAFGAAAGPRASPLRHLPRSGSTMVIASITFGPSALPPPKVLPVASGASGR